MIKKYTIDLSLPIQFEVDADSDNAARILLCDNAAQWVTPEQITEAWTKFNDDPDPALNYLEIICAEPQESVWIVETLTIIDGWTNCYNVDEVPQTFETEKAAKAELIDHFSTMQDNGMEFDHFDYRIAELPANEQENQQY